MKIRNQIILGLVTVCFLFVLPSHAIVGVGFHYGFDFTLSMDDAENIPVSLKDYKDSLDIVSLINNLPVPIPIDSIGGWDIDTLFDSLNTLLQQGQDVPILSGDLPFYISRTGFERYFLNFGGKFFIDIIPAIDAIELSLNFGLWQYDGSLKYPTNIKQFDTADVQALLDDPTSVTFESFFEMAEAPITLETFDLAYFGLNKTPYAKLHIDATIRKNLVAVPDKMKIFKIYAGGGPSVHFATPVLSQEMVEDVLKDMLEETGGDINKLSEMLSGDPQALKPVVEKIIEGLTVPKFGMHIIAGMMIKLPVVPLGFYVDGKFMIPFGDIDEEAGLKGYGLLFNTGISFGL